MTRENIRKSLVEIFKSVVLADDIPEINDDLPLTDQLGTDSLDFLEIVMELKIRYNVEVPDEDFKEFKTMESTLNYLESRMKNL